MSRTSDTFITNILMLTVLTHTQMSLVIEIKIHIVTSLLRTSYNLLWQHYARCGKQSQSTLHVFEDISQVPTNQAIVSFAAKTDLLKPPTLIVPHQKA